MDQHQTLAGRRIVLGITGGIAAYKTPEIVRRLHEAGAEVRIILTRSAHQFVTTPALEAVGATVIDDRFGSAMPHIDLARWAELVLVAPATAHLLARVATGAADDLLTTLCLATEAPVVLAPAMNRVMWQKKATQDNCRRLIEQGVLLLGPDDGSQACGDTGPGRMRDVPLLVDFVQDFWGTKLLAGLTAVVTAGPTYEPLDPVRGFTNRSSGKMGYALANALRAAGANVILISGPVTLATPPGVQRIDVVTAQEMLNAVTATRGHLDLFIGTAAVADYRPTNMHTNKIKKGAPTLTVTLVHNPDILAEVASWRPAPFTVGFAAETENLEANARAKLHQKGLDLIVANPVGMAGVGFDADTNQLTLIDRDTATTWPLASKKTLAEHLVREITHRIRRPVA
ncbi:MAG: bifunctional phosphopantothenoylcysteine decarboxylase/phosphopantothenate--cysteine ligase CoaBC [Acidiferrobacter sp.]